MIFTEKRWADGFLMVCGDLWPGARDGAPMPDGYPDHWRSGQPPAAERLAEGDTPNDPDGSDLGVPDVHP